MQVTGRATITYNGQTLNTKPGAKLDPGGITSTSMTSDQQVDFSEKLRPSKLSCEVHWNPGTNLVELNGIKDATIQFICDTGDVYVIEQARRTGEIEGTAGDNGGIPLVFEGPAATAVASGA